MSLDWDITKVKDYKKNFPGDENGQMNDAVHVTIWATLAVDIGEITEKNADAFYNRLELWYEEVSPLFTKVNEDDELEPYMPTREQIHQLVGLKTNVTTTTAKQFLAKVDKIVRGARLDSNKY